MKNGKKSMPSFLFDMSQEEAQTAIQVRKVIRTNINASGLMSKGFVFTQPSLTVPDQSMSIGEIIRRFASGLPLGGQRVPLYEDEGEDMFDGVNPKSLDITERHDILHARLAERDSILAEEKRRQARNKYPKKTPPEAEKKSNAESSASPSDKTPKDGTTS